MVHDRNNVAFMGLDFLLRRGRDKEIDSSIYDKVFEGQVWNNKLSEGYRRRIKYRSSDPGQEKSFPPEHTKKQLQIFIGEILWEDVSSYLANKAKANGDMEVYEKVVVLRERRKNQGGIYPTNDTRGSKRYPQEFDARSKIKNQPHNFLDKQKKSLKNCVVISSLRTRIKEHRDTIDWINLFEIIVLMAKASCFTALLINLLTY